MAPESIEKFCEYLGITRNYYDILVERLVNKIYLQKIMKNGNLNMKDIKTDQEKFWAGEFGNSISNAIKVKNYLLLISKCFLTFFQKRIR